MSTATERYKIIQNIIAQKGIDCDLFVELARTEAMINSIEQGKMIPPPLPPELNANQGTLETPQETLPTNEIPPIQNG